MYVDPPDHHGYYILEVDGFPFFGTDFEYEIKRDTETLGSPLGQTFAVKQQDYTASFTIEGRHAIEQIETLAHGQDGVPEPVNMEVKLLGQGKLYTMEDVLVSGVTARPEGGTYHGYIDVVANDFTKYTNT